jgi:hypothetical protein
MRSIIPEGTPRSLAIRAIVAVAALDACVLLHRPHWTRRELQPAPLNVQILAKARKQTDAQVSPTATLVLSDVARMTLAMLVPSNKLPPIEFNWISDIKYPPIAALGISRLKASASPSTISPAIEIVTAPLVVGCRSTSAAFAGTPMNRVSKTIPQTNRAIAVLAVMAPISPP